MCFCICFFFFLERSQNSWTSFQKGTPPLEGDIRSEYLKQGRTFLSWNDVKKSIFQSLATKGHSWQRYYPLGHFPLTILILLQYFGNNILFIYISALSGLQLPHQWFLDHWYVLYKGYWLFDHVQIEEVIGIATIWSLERFFIVLMYLHFCFWNFPHEKFLSHIIIRYFSFLISNQ